MTLEPKRGSYTSVIEQCRGAMRDQANGSLQACNGGGEMNEHRDADCATKGVSPNSEKSAQESLPKEENEEESLAATLARVVTEVDDAAVVSIAESMVAQTAASMVETSHSCRTYSLYRPFDVQHLSDRQCYVRRELIEVFHTDSYAKGRVALRCKFCHHVPYADRANGSMIFPRSLSALCTSIGYFTCHLQKCAHIPKEMKEAWSKLSSTPAGAQVKQYWIESAEKIGLIDVENGKLDGISMKSNSPTKAADAIQKGSRYTRIKLLATEILSDQQEAKAEATNVANIATVPSRKRKRTKQGGRPRLLKLPVAPHRTCPEHMKNRAGRVGVYLPEARKERIARFHSKRQDRIARFYSKDILYEVRRNKANATKREGGRFVKKCAEEVKDESESVGATAEADVSDHFSEASATDDEVEVLRKIKGGDMDDSSEASAVEMGTTKEEEEEEEEEGCVIVTVQHEVGDMVDVAPAAEVLCD